MMKEADILYQNGDHWIIADRRGNFEVYRLEVTHGVRCAIIGRNYTNAFERAKAECDRRESEKSPAIR